MNKLVLLLMWCILPLSSSLLACHETTVSQISATFNNDGSVTYDLDVCIGSEDTWGFELSFVSNGSIVNVGTASITDPTTSVSITPTITSATTVEFGDFDNTSAPLFHAALTGQACFTINITLSEASSSVTIDGAEFTFGPCSGATALQSCFEGNADYVIEVTSDNCAGNNISFELQDASGTPIAGVSGIPTDGATRSWVWCGGCVSFFQMNAPASSGGSPSTRCDPGLCCVEGSGSYSLTTSGGAVTLINSTMSGLSVETTNVTNCNVLLNNEFVDFSASLDQQVVDLNWSFKNISAGTMFEVQKSVDGINFEKFIVLQQVDSVSGIGYFSAQDFYPYDGENYYRLKYSQQQQDLNYSNVISIDVELGNNLIDLYPNPAQDFFRFYYENKSMGHADIQLIVSDLSGKELKKHQFNMIPSARRNFNIPVADLDNGMYIVEIISGANKTTRKLHIVR